MADIKRTTEGLEHCLARYDDGLCDDCPYMGEIDRSYMIPMKCKEIIMRDALEMLKEKRPMGQWDYGTQCSVCKGTIIPPKDRSVRINFCPWCGADMRGGYDG